MRMTALWTIMTVGRLRFQQVAVGREGQRIGCGPGEHQARGPAFMDLQIFTLERIADVVQFAGVGCVRLFQLLVEQLL